MSPKSLLKKTNKLYNPLVLKRRLDTYYAMQEGIEIKPNVPLPLNPKDLTNSQQNIVIEHLKFNEAMLIIEIADYIQLTRQTVSSRLKIIRKENKQILEDQGFGVMDIIYDLKRDINYVKLQAKNKNDPDLFLKASLAYIDRLLSLGVVYEKPKELEINYPMHSEADEKLIIKHLRKLELEALNVQPIKDAEEQEIIEVVSEESKQ